MTFRKRPSFIQVVSSSWFLAVLAFATLASACGPEQPRVVEFPARPTPTPDGAEAPTPTSESAVPITDWNLGASSTGSDLVALLSEEERSCLQTALGDRHGVFLSTPFSEDGNLDTGSTEVADCLTPESTAGIVIAMFSDSAGGLSAETRGCLADVFTANPQGVLALAAGAPPGDAAGSISFDVLSCLTPEEAAAMTPSDEGPPPDTAGLRCLTEELMKLEGGEEVVRILSTADPAGLTLEQSALLGQAVDSCGIETDFTFPDPGSTG